MATVALVVLIVANCNLEVCGTCVMSSVSTYTLSTIMSTIGSHWIVCWVDGCIENIYKLSCMSALNFGSVHILWVFLYIM